MRLKFERKNQAGRIGAEKSGGESAGYQQPMIPPQRRASPDARLCFFRLMFFMRIPIPKTTSTPLEQLAKTMIAHRQVDLSPPACTPKNVTINPPITFPLPDHFCFLLSTDDHRIDFAFDGDFTLSINHAHRNLTALPIR